MRKGESITQLALSRTPIRFETNQTANRFRRQLTFVSLRKISVVCFVEVTRILIEPMFGLDIHAEAPTPVGGAAPSRDRKRGSPVATASLRTPSAHNAIRGQKAGGLKHPPLLCS